MNEVQPEEASTSGNTTWPAELATMTESATTETVASSPSTASLSEVDEAIHKRNSQSLSSELGLPSPSLPASPVLPADYDETEHQDQEVAVPVTPLSPISATVPDRLRQLAAIAWAKEQDEGIEEDRLAQIDKVLKQLDELLDDRQETDQELHKKMQQTSSGSGNELDAQVNAEDEDEDEDEDEEYIVEQDLYNVHDYLVSTVQEMRLRTQEQRHLHSLTTSKLETVVQRSLAQDDHVTSLTSLLSDQRTCLMEMGTERDGLRRENHILGTENDALRLQHDETQAHVKALEAEVQRQAVALAAMTSAVTGLEQWMEQRGDNQSNPEAPVMMQSELRGYSHESNSNRPQLSSRPTSSPHRSRSNAQVGARTVIRGKGRFRGRYQVDVDDDGDPYGSAISPGSDGTYPSPYLSPSHNDAMSKNYFPPPHQRGAASSHRANGRITDLQDDVRGWIRGCRDVLECAQAGAGALQLPPMASDSHRLGLANGDDPVAANGPGREIPNEDDWGDFQGVQTVA